MDPRTVDLVISGAVAVRGDQQLLEVLLRTWETLGREQGKDPVYVQELAEAQRIVRESPDIWVAIARLRVLAMRSDPAAS